MCFGYTREVRIASFCFAVITLCTNCWWDGHHVPLASWHTTRTVTFLAGGSAAGRSCEVSPTFQSTFGPIPAIRRLPCPKNPKKEQPAGQEDRPHPPPPVRSSAARSTLWWCLCRDHCFTASVSLCPQVKSNPIKCGILPHIGAAPISVPSSFAWTLNV